MGPNAHSAPAALARRGAQAALGRRDAARKGFTARAGQGKLGPRPARAVKSGGSIAPFAGAAGGGRCSRLLVLVGLFLVLDDV